MAKLNASVNDKLTLVSAPAGFGKTTLVTDWLSQGERPFVWFSLDEDDNDPMRFFAYTAAAVQQVEGVSRGVQGLLQSTQPVPLKTVTTALINDCTAVSTPFVLVFDDFHVITETAVQEAISFFIDNLPPQLHLVITSRTDPLLPLSRLRARGQMTELRTHDLRFTAQEAADFLQQVMGLSLSAVQVAALEARTEGWVAGLQMAALSIQGLKREDEVSAFVTDFTGTHRYIFDYLTDEVLQQRPSDTQAFLLQTSLLDRFNASLCTAVTGQNECQAILQTLENANLFLFPLDEKREWYRYHHLFADLLRQRLQRRQPDQIPRLYQRASRWYAARGEVETAVQYALAGEDGVEAARLLDQVALDFISRSEIAKLIKLAEKLPSRILPQHLQLCLALGWAYVFMNRFEAAEVYIQWAEDCLANSTGISAHFPAPLARAYIATILAYSATRQEDLPAAITFANKALAWLDELPPEMDQRLRGSILIILGQTQAALDEIEKAEVSYRQAIDSNQVHGRVFGTLASYSGLMKLLQGRGQLIKAKAVGLQAIKWIKSIKLQNNHSYPAEGEVRRELSIIHYEQNELSQAKEQIEKALDLYRYSSLPAFARCLHYLFLVELAGGELETAVAVHQQIDPLLIELPPILYRVYAAKRIERIRRLWRVQPDAPQWQDEMRQWLTGLDPTPPSAIIIHQEPETMIQARILTAVNQLKPSLAILNHLADAAESSGRFGDLIHCRVQQVLVLQQLNQSETAVTYLTQALTLAEKDTYRRTFLDEAEGLRPLLPKLPQTPLRDKLMREINHPGPVSAQAALPDPLSQRELEVLVMLATHLTGPEIADQLHISPNTFKTHTKNIYSKLGVNGRNEAVIKAQELGLR